MNNPLFPDSFASLSYRGIEDIKEAERLLQQFLQTKLETLIGFEPKQNS